MKLHSLKFKQIVAKVLYLLASLLCTQANKVLAKISQKLIDEPVENWEVSSPILDYMQQLYREFACFMDCDKEGGESDDG